MITSVWSGAGYVGLGLRWWEGKTNKLGSSEDGARQNVFKDSQEYYRAFFELKQELLGQGWQVGEYPEITQG